MILKEFVEVEVEVESFVAVLNEKVLEFRIPTRIWGPVVNGVV